MICCMADPEAACNALLGQAASYNSRSHMTGNALLGVKLEPSRAIHQQHMPFEQAERSGQVCHAASRITSALQLSVLPRATSEPL